ncbi:hypothetical protein SAMN06295967_103266 [Belliella buryatensis]|jgi:hypothetical protein|uniref:DUF5683 domain-containing protein n=1 Tax=Belliella buryatensis TaxID=1500549 RepID=A0A239BWK6_9BACT|nr:hypothetical protein [Belliella buryatensis]SNS12032.1 hypothetical protein SAMN06295967_103266 [Belliella buryatensis]
MKKLTLILFFLAFAFTSFGQQAKTFIDTKNRLLSAPKYYQNETRLKNSEIKTLMELNSDTKQFLDKALRSQKIVLPLYVITTVGLISTFFISDSGTRDIVGLSATGLGITASIFEANYNLNVQRAVNLYNKNLFEGQKTSTRLDFKVDPLASGLVLTF